MPRDPWRGAGPGRSSYSGGNKVITEVLHMPIHHELLSVCLSMSGRREFSANIRFPIGRGALANNDQYLQAR